jgi:hypothetical protein
MFLTPVFFISVDRLSQSRLFSSPAVRFVGKAAMILLTLGFVGIAYRTLAKSRNGNPEKNEEDTGI